MERWIHIYRHISSDVHIILDSTLRDNYSLITEMIEIIADPGQGEFCCWAQLRIVNLL